MNQKIFILLQEMIKTQDVLEHIWSIFSGIQFDEVFTKKELRDAVFLSDIFVSYYTALETFFLRVSEFFENDLDTKTWHRSLLNKMRLEIPGIRVAVISTETYDLADEFLRFRHFKRYYFEFRFDWDRFEFF